MFILFTICLKYQFYAYNFVYVMDFHALLLKVYVWNRGKLKSIFKTHLNSKENKNNEGMLISLQDISKKKKVEIC